MLNQTKSQTCTDQGCGSQMTEAGRCSSRPWRPPDTSWRAAGTGGGASVFITTFIITSSAPSESHLSRAWRQSRAAGHTAGVSAAAAAPGHGGDVHNIQSSKYMSVLQEQTCLTTLTIPSTASTTMETVILHPAPTTTRRCADLPTGETDSFKVDFLFFFIPIIDIYNIIISHSVFNSVRIF